MEDLSIHSAFWNGLFRRTCSWNRNSKFRIQQKRMTPTSLVVRMSVCPSNCPLVRLSACPPVCPHVPQSSASLRLAPCATAMSVKTWICFHSSVECEEVTKIKTNTATNSGTCTVNRSHICEMSPSLCSHPLYAKCKSLASKSLQVAHKLCQRNFF